MSHAEVERGGLDRHGDSFLSPYIPLLSLPSSFFHSILSLVDYFSYNVDDLLRITCSLPSPHRFGQQDFHSQSTAREILVRRQRW